jgi:hypothetical protein
MKWPNCPETALVMSDRQDVEIERSAAMAPASASGGAARRQTQFDDSNYGHERSPQGQRKKSWLKNIFD